jgi:PAS domain S-box-containing protein
MESTGEVTDATLPSDGEVEAVARTFVGEGEMAARCRALDWAATPLGPVSGWPAALRTAVRLMLATPIATSLWCGPGYTLLYNDAYRCILGVKHPAALGRSGADVWDELWPALQAPFEQVRAGGPPVYADEALLVMARLEDGSEDAWFTYSLSALTDDAGECVAIYNVAVETTERVRARAASEAAHASLQAQALELELTNEQLQDSASELEAQTEALQATALQLEERTAEAEAGRARMAAVLEGMSDAHFTLDAEFRFVAVNGAQERGSGLSREQLLGRTLWEIFPETVGTEFERYYRAVAEHREEAHFAHDYTDARFSTIAEVDVYPAANGGIAVFWRDVTARVRAEAALRESEARYRALFESIDSGFCVIEMLFDERGEPVDYRFVETNPAFVQQTGLVDAVGRTVRELVPDLEAHWIEMYGRVATTGEAVRFENGSDAMGRWFDVYAFRLGRPEDARVALLFNEVSAVRSAARERERLIDALEVERARLAYAFQQAPAFLAILRGATHVFELVNDAYYGLVGHRELLGRTVFDALPEVRDQHFIALLDRVLAAGEPFVGREVPLLIARTPGAPPEKRYVDFVYLALVEADGTRTGVVAHGSDVTEQVLARHEVERLLAESEEARQRTEAVLASIADAFYLLDREWRFTYVNDAAEPLLQTTRDALLGRTLWEAFPGVAGSPFEGPYRAAMDEGRHTSAEAYFEPLGTWFDVRSYPWSGGLMVHFRDIGDRKRAEAERERLLADAQAARREAEGANRAKGEFLAVMSHELRTPLNAIGGYAELMELGLHGPVTAEQRTALERIQRSQRHLLGLINGVLNYTRVEAGAVHYDMEDVLLDEALATCEALTAPQVRGRQLAFMYRHCEPALTVWADREKLQQVVLNLLTNSVKFTGPGGRVELACSATPSEVRVTVTDDGRGIPAEQLARVFEPFVQIDTRLTRTQDGVGLGLAISRDLARGMGGDLTAESTLGEGSRFTLVLPRMDGGRP